ncbi:hypothetical protein K6Q96_24385 [Grimontia kaedaensis]|uniref:Uncharacterized protein n=1 Tax=Grimontia kaedaensis TaxID=2872157 RepID=A0ABY4X0V0_9GAMM|nr:hypothetical protein [Grimontia kaedaensis]USH04842.1 hypothetical protein K6Q96_24385 [Grimontia kaedaensis]
MQATSGEGDNQVTMTLVNIPLDSAKGLKTWEGPSVVYNLSTNEGLLHNLEELEESLKSQEFAVTLSTSDTNWAWGKTWSPNDSFTMTRLGARYFGIVPFEGPNPFGSL